MTGRIFSQRPLYTLTIGSAVVNANARTLLSNPTVVGDVVIEITSAGVCYSNTPATAGLRIGSGWPAGCTFKVVNNGALRGDGGDGGGGGSNGGGSGSSGAAAGDALDLDGQPVSLDNTGGTIYGGGGGGGGGGGAVTSGGGGGGGGGGQSYGGTSGAGGGSGSPAGSTGGAGNTTNPGAGGGASNGGQAAGRGGFWGEAGQAGDVAGVNGGAGGAPGRAVRLNSGSVTWLGGNNASQVRGAVS